jgi:hypothetical protein
MVYGCILTKNFIYYKKPKKQITTFLNIRTEQPTSNVVVVAAINAQALWGIPFAF